MRLSPSGPQESFSVLFGGSQLQTTADLLRSINSPGSAIPIVDSVPNGLASGVTIEQRSVVRSVRARNRVVGTSVVVSVHQVQKFLTADLSTKIDCVGATVTVPNNSTAPVSTSSLDPNPLAVDPGVSPPTPSPTCVFQVGDIMVLKVSGAAPAGTYPSDVEVEVTMETLLEREDVS